jgi:carbon-monoxide dehydrogenase medium subunit
MYLGRFDYTAPEDVTAAVVRLAAATEAGDDARVLAGGHSLIPDLKAGATTPDLLVDVGRLDALRGVTVTDGVVRIGAATTYVDAARASATDRCPALADALAVVGDRQVRNRGTVGGNLAEAAVGTDMPAPVLAADGRLVIQGPAGERTTTLTAFYDDGATLGPAELLIAVEIPTAKPASDRPGDSGDGGVAAGAYVKRAHPHTGYPLLGVAAEMETADGVVEHARVAVTGATPAAPAVRLRPVEEALLGASPVEEGSVAAAAARAPEAPTVDVAGIESDVVSPSYREHLLEVYTERALSRAAERTTGGAT